MSVTTGIANGMMHVMGLRRMARSLPEARHVRGHTEHLQENEITRGDMTAARAACCRGIREEAQTGRFLRG